MNIKSILSVCAIALFVSIACVAMPARAEAEDEYCGPRHKWGSAEKQEKFDKMIEKLGLSDEQVARLKEHKQAKMESREKLYSALSEQKKALKDELEKPVSDNARIKQIADSIKQVQSEMVDERIKGILEIKAILTPEQYSEFKANIRSYKERKKMKYADGEEKPSAKRHYKKY
jgi:Spy/CpxP family protein refolding chaperone